MSFSAEKAGASEVVSFDIDTAAHQHLLPFAGSEYVVDHASWVRKQTAGFQAWKNAYWLGHRLLGSKAKVIYGKIYEITPHLGSFDVIIVGSILEHLSDPVRALGSLAKHSHDKIVVTTEFIDSENPVAHFNGRPELPDNNYVFWTYSIGLYRNIFNKMGFEIIECRKDKYHGAKSFTEDKGDMWERVTIVAQRCAESRG